MNDVPAWYYVIAAVVTVYQASRGYLLQWKFGRPEISGRLLRIYLLCAADALFYAVCAAFGFAALWIAYVHTARLPSLADVSAGGAALLIALWLLGVLGVTAQLPYLIQHKGIPGLLMPGGK